MAGSGRRVVITGSAGIIGSVLRAGLGGGWEIVPCDLPDCDVRDAATVAGCLAGASRAVHLAWTTEVDHFRASVIDPDNAAMALNVLDGALRAGVRRVVLASSVHADTPPPAGRGMRASTATVATPDSLYGAHKLFVEALGRYYATRGLDVIAVRFGGVNPADELPSDHEGRAVWLSHRDCSDLVQKCLDAAVRPGRYQCLYAVSDNRGSWHDLSNPFGWTPSDGDAAGG
jgi:nucleoside-diphosphate-sugar epimerase